MDTKLKAIWAIIVAQVKDIWNRSKIFILAIAALIITLEFQKLKELIIVYLGNKELKNDKKEDATLAAKESSENQQADILVKKAQNESADDDWNEK